MKILKKLIAFTIIIGVVLSSLASYIAYTYDPGFFRFLFKASPRIIKHYTVSQLIDYYNVVKFYYKTGKSLNYDYNKSILTFDNVIADSVEKKDYYNAGYFAFHQGKFEQAISYLNKFNQEHSENENSIFWLALSYMKLAELNNCLNPGTTEKKAVVMQMDQMPMCSLPLTMIHNDKSYSKSAIELFLKLLDNYDSKNKRYIWLLNFSYMTIGQFPEQVPSKYLIKSKFTDFFYGDSQIQLKNKYPNLSLIEKAKNFGIDKFDAGKGVAIEDFDRDGDLDIITGGFYVSTHYYENQNGTAFIDKSKSSNISKIKGAHLITAADYNNDGWVDLFISHVTGTNPNGGFALLENQQNGTFKNVTISSGLLSKDSLINNSTWTWNSAWGDIDLDGDLDLFICNYQGYNIYHHGVPTYPSYLYRNDNGKFTDVTEAYGLKEVLKNECLTGAAFGDYNDDGYPDLAIAGTTGGFNLLYKNINGEKFSSTNLINTKNEIPFMVSFLDANHDGKLDIFYANIGPADSAIKYAAFDNMEKKFGFNRLLIQTDDGNFEEMNPAFQTDFPIATMSNNFGDLNNDGAFDYYFGTGGPEPWFIMPNMLFIGKLDNGQPTGQVENITPLFGVGNIQKGHGIVFFDFDNDGDQDIYSSLGGAWPSDAWPNQFFVNESKNNNSWVKIRLQGSKSNYYGLGAKIKVTAINKGGEKRIRHYLMDNKSGFGSSPYLAHIGLYDSVEITDIEVRWPCTKKPQHYNGNIKALNLLKEENLSIVQK